MTNTQPRIGYGCIRLNHVSNDDYVRHSDQSTDTHSARPSFVMCFQTAENSFARVGSIAEYSSLVVIAFIEAQY
eukprot:m.28055 g.28055  ORF g.28055 m.28055 type:complete len:74 (-) comp6497_c0_seq1:4861-5082(-)